MNETSNTPQNNENSGSEQRLVIPYGAAQQNTAVALCCVAYERARKTALASRRTSSRAHELAEKAYKEAFPALYGRDRIRDFIACVTQGSLMGIFSDSECKRLLYAAQVAKASADRPAPQLLQPEKSSARY